MPSPSRSKYSTDSDSDSEVTCGIAPETRNSASEASAKEAGRSCARAGKRRMTGIGDGMRGEDLNSEVSVAVDSGGRKVGIDTKA